MEMGGPPSELWPSWSPGVKAESPPLTLAAPRHAGQYLLSHSRLLWRVTWNELRARYAGSVLGLGWAVLTPLMVLAIYATVYLFVFRVQVPGLTPAGYVLFIFSGLVPFLMTSEALSGGVASVSANKSVWSNTIFPADLAPVKAVLLGQMPMLVGLPCLVLALALSGGLHWPLLLVPAVWALHVLALIGLTWALSLVNLVLRDLQNLVSLLLMALMVASPIAYTTEMVPAGLKPLLAFNPFAYYVITYQNILVLGRWPAAADLAILAGTAVAAFGLGGLFFARAKALLIDYA